MVLPADSVAFHPYAMMDALVDVFDNAWQISRGGQCILSCLSEGPELDNAQPQFNLD